MNNAATIDRTRTSYAKAASHGLGMGQIEARRYMAELGEDDLNALHAQLLKDVEVSRALAQSRSVPFTDYVAELVDKGQVERGERLELVYRAGFDVGFSTCLVESLVSDSSYAPDVEAVPDSGVSQDSMRIS
jgi:hypothetical protein